MKNWIITALAVGLAIIGTLAVVAQTGGARVEVRVWEHLDDDRDNRVSARVDGGSWRGAFKVAMDGVSGSGVYRYGDVRIDSGGTRVYVRVWERVDDPSRNYVSVRSLGGSWGALGTIPLGREPASEYKSLANGRFRYSDIALTVDTSRSPAPPSRPTATPEDADSDTATATPAPSSTATPVPTATPSASDLAESCSFEDSLPRVRAATVQVTGSSSRNFSTAFHIGNGEFVTTAHSVTMGERVTLTADGGYRTYAVVVERGDYEDRPRNWAEVGEDVALLHASAIPSAALDWAVSGEGDDWSGDPVAVVGYSWGSVQRTARGNIQGIHGDGRAINVIITSEREPAPGNSGSPIVDACGAVRGMVSSGQRTSDDDDAPATASGPRSTALVARLALDGEPRENAMLARRAAVPAPIPTAVPEAGAGGVPAGGGGAPPAGGGAPSGGSGADAQPTPTPGASRAERRAALVAYQERVMAALLITLALEWGPVNDALAAAESQRNTLIAQCNTELQRLQGPRNWIQYAVMYEWCRGQEIPLVARINQLITDLNAMRERHRAVIAGAQAAAAADLAAFDAQS